LANKGKGSTTDFVLIPGAWMSAWVWEPVAHGLRELGHGAGPVTLSGLTDEDANVSDVRLATHVDDVLSILEEDDLRRAVVVGHSYSGMVAGQVADRAPGRVAHTVFIEAFLPRDGRSMLDGFSESQREDELRQISENGGRWPAPDSASLANERDLSSIAETLAVGAFHRTPGAHGLGACHLESVAGGAAGDLRRLRVRGPDDVAAMYEGRTGLCARSTPPTGPSWCRPPTGSSHCSPKSHQNRRSNRWPVR
jgi:pimeloyl-ACP methyl ester carboxylesterase